MNSTRLNIVLGVIAILMLAHLTNSINDISDREVEINERIDNLERIVNTKYSVNYTNRDVDCLTKNIYYEAGNQDDVGKYAVATVTLNRLKTGRWGNSVCKVVYSPYQFSWTLLRSLRKPDPDIYNRSREIAVKSLEGHRVFGLDESLLYHADYIAKPKWAYQKERVAKIGAHIFYRSRT